MEEPRLFEDWGAVEALSLNLTRRENGWELYLASRRESDPLRWSSETYEGLTWAEALDVLTAVAFS